METTPTHILNVNHSKNRIVEMLSYEGHREGSKTQ